MIIMHHEKSNFLIQDRDLEQHGGFLLMSGVPLFLGLINYSWFHRSDNWFHL